LAAATCGRGTRKSAAAEAVSARLAAGAGGLVLPEGPARARGLRVPGTRSGSGSSGAGLTAPPLPASVSPLQGVEWKSNGLAQDSVGSGKTRLTPANRSTLRGTGKRFR
jgi:hypothetical protein